MKKTPSTYCVAAAIILITTLAFGWAGADDAGSITSAYVAPDARNILLKYEGPIGKHVAFIMQNPSRLVVDFDATRLGPVPRKIKVSQEPIDEVRLGYDGGRARLVVDFGERPVPSFKVQRGPNLVSIFLNDAEGQAESSERVKPRASSSVSSSWRPPGWTPSVAKEDDASIRVKTAGIKDNLVFVELTDRKDPKFRYRLVVDVDVNALRVKNAALSDAKGNVKRFDLADAEGSPSAPADSPRSVTIGPRKDVVASDTGQPSAKPKFKWGLPATDAGRTPNKVGKTGSLHIEEFQLRPKNSDPR